VRLPPPGKVVRVIGFDDAPFPRRPRVRVRLTGVVCSDTRFEGMVHGSVTKDGLGATDEIIRLLVGGKFLPQLRLVLLDGIAFGGFNLVDLPRLAAALGRPCVAVMRKPPDLAGIERVLAEMPSAARRLALLRRAGPIYDSPPFHFQVQGASPSEIARLLPRLTDRGHVPEALRLAHLIGTALVTGESGTRA
jgi:hypothetical protein